MPVLIPVPGLFQVFGACVVSPRIAGRDGLYWRSLVEFLLLSQWSVQVNVHEGNRKIARGKGAPDSMVVRPATFGWNHGNTGVW